MRLTKEGNTICRISLEEEQKEQLQLCNKMKLLRGSWTIPRGGLLIILLGILPSTKGFTCEHLNTNSEKFLLDPVTRNCHQFGTRGPCPEMMLFYAHPLNPEHGFCDCDQGYKTGTSCNDSPTRKRVYYPMHNRCYSVFSQGPCRDGLWVTVSGKGNLKCEVNRCKRHMQSTEVSDQFWYFDPYRRVCLQTLTRGYCEDTYTLELVHESQYPTCQKKTCYPSLVSGIRSPLACAPGSRFSYLTESCQKINNRRLNVG